MTGSINFNAISTAATASIINRGHLRFNESSTAASATITNHNNIFFLGNSTGGNAAITNIGGALVDFSGSTGPAGDNKLTAGSIAGAGTFLLGANELSVGGNNLSTDVSGVISGMGGSLVKVGTGTLTLSGTNTYTGATSVNAGTLRAVALNTFSPSSAMTIASGGTLDLNGFNQTLASVANAGLVNMGTRTAPGTVLTTRSYMGTGGTIAMNTVLGADNSPSDRLVINGGQASGNSTLSIANAGGFGDLTTANGIQVVSAVGGGTTLPARLRSAASSPLACMSISCSKVAWHPAQRMTGFCARQRRPRSRFLPSRFLPIRSHLIRRLQVLCYLPNPAFHCSVRRQRFTRCCRVSRGSWSLRHSGPSMSAKVIRRCYSDQVHSLAPGAASSVARSKERRSGRLSPEFEGNLAGFQMGQDVFGWDYDAHRDRLGLFFGYARSDVEARGFALAQQRALVGALPMDSTSFGAYWTHLGPSKWYVDAVLMASWFDGDPRSTRGVELSAEGTGFTASVEAGYPIPIGAGWGIEPQAQLIWQRVKFDQALDPFATVDFDPAQALTGRIGARLFGDVVLSSMTLKPYLLASVWRNFPQEATRRLSTSRRSKPASAVRRWSSAAES